MLDTFASKDNGCWVEFDTEEMNVDVSGFFSIPCFGKLCLQSTPTHFCEDINEIQVFWSIMRILCILNIAWHVTFNALISLKWINVYIIFEIYYNYVYDFMQECSMYIRRLFNTMLKVKYNIWMFYNVFYSLLSIWMYTIYKFQTNIKIGISCCWYM